jgi:hypothetical protein
VSLRDFLDARRDTDQPLCVCAGIATAFTVAVTVAVDPRREVAPVAAAVTAAALAPESPLVPVERALGQPLDRSDVLLVVHAVPGVLGVPVLTVPGVPAADPLGRRVAARWELLVPGLSVTGVTA